MKHYIIRSVLVVVLLATIWPSFTAGVPAARASSLPSALAAPGTLDSTFAGFTDDGKVVETGAFFTDMALQPDGKIVTAVTTPTANRLAVFRYLPDGQLDTTFADDGKAVYLDMFSASHIAVQADARIVVGGTRDGDFHLARLDVYGTLDRSFDQDGWLADVDAVPATLNDILVQSNGAIVACGDAEIGGDYDFIVTRYTTAGRRDTSFAGDGTITIPFGGGDICYGIAQQPDGKLVVVGSHYVGNTKDDFDFALARLHPNGTLDTSFAGDGKLTTEFDGDGGLDSVAIQPDGKIIAVGAIQNTSRIARYLPDGKLDKSFDGDGWRTISGDQLSELALQPDGKIVLLGTHASQDNSYKLVVQRLLPTGAHDPSFDFDGSVLLDFGTDTWGTALALYPDGRILTVGGKVGGGGLARLWPDGTTLDTGGLQTHGLSRPPAQQAGEREVVNGMAILPDGSYVVAGQVYNATTTSSNGFVTHFTAQGQVATNFGENGSARIASGIFSAVKAVAVQRDGLIVVAGFVAFKPDYSVMDFVVARFLPGGALDSLFGAGGMTRIDFAGGPDGAAALAIAPDGKIVLAGNAWNGSRSVWGVTRLTPGGQLDNSFDGDGKAYVDFELGNSATAVVVQPDGKIIVGGNARIAGSAGNSDFFLQRLLVNGARDASYGINGGGYNFTDLGGTDVISALALAPNGFLYAAGQRTRNGNIDMALAQYTPDGRLATCAANAPCFTWPTGTLIVDRGTNDLVSALDLRDDNQLVAVGCSNRRFAGVQTRTDGPPAPLHFDANFVGDECAKAVQFAGADKIVMAGDQDLYPFSSDTNIALARFQTTPEQSTPVPPPVNLVANPGFELDADNDTRPDRWAVTPTNANVTRATSVKVGGNVLRFGPTNLPTATVGQRVVNVRAGAIYGFDSQVNIPATTDSFTFDIDVRCHSATNAVLSTSRIRRFTGATSGFERTVAHLQAPTGATNAVVLLVATNLQATVEVDNIGFAIDNLLQNPGFELDQNSDTRPDAWSINPNVTRDGSVKRSGAYAMRHAATTNATYAVGQKLTGLRGGTPYVVTGWVNIPSTTDVFLFEFRVVWLNADGAIVGRNVVKTYTDDTAGTWNRAAQVLIAPADATQALLQQQISGLSATISVDDMAFRP